MTNLSEKDILFKIRSNSKLNYKVSPHHGKVYGNNDLKISVIYHCTETYDEFEYSDYRQDIDENR